MYSKIDRNLHLCMLITLKWRHLLKLEYIYSTHIVLYVLHGMCHASFYMLYKASPSLFHCYYF